MEKVCIFRRVRTELHKLLVFNFEAVVRRAVHHAYLQVFALDQRVLVVLEHLCRYLISLALLVAFHQAVPQKVSLSLRRVLRLQERVLEIERALLPQR